MAALRSCGWETRHWMARLRSCRWETRHWMARLRSCGWEMRHWMARLRSCGASCICSHLRQDPPGGLEVRTSCPNLQSDILVVRLGGSEESGAGGCAAGWICRGGRWRSRGERVAAGGWSTIEPLLAVVCREGVARYLRHDIDSFGPIKFSATLDLNDRRT
jgi:hypothetical protein